MKDDFKRKLWISFGIIFGSFIVYFGAIYFLSNSISGSVDQIVSQRTAIETDANNVASFATLKADAAQALKYDAAITNLLPDQYGLINISNQLSNLGTKHAVTVDFSFQGSLTPSQPNTPGNAPFSIDAAGTPTNLVAFLKDIEEQAPGFLLSLNSFDYTNDGQTGRIVAQGVLYFR